jgi:hypothetical protein
MATIYGNEQDNVATPTRPIERDADTGLRVITRTFPLTTNDHSADDFRMTLPKGFRPLLLGLYPSGTLGSTTLAVGISGTAGKYRAAATLTATSLAPVLMGTDEPLTADEEVIIDPAAANLPASGTLRVRFFGTQQ